ncbi:hypothetical protein BDN72DRAFT_407493 [Pluteus cervinus]|uniref:Uncharacterized protein n=1 Tax=Pluteus cervinus TaxID=181527 RepID=A0ACD3B1T5_9AGAR|nr:hypothetical protein BDN72DRAFT_407493 [Pluteus cervinus]
MITRRFVAARPITSSGTLEAFVSSSNSALPGSPPLTQSVEPTTSRHGPQIIRPTDAARQHVEEVPDLANDPSSSSFPGGVIFFGILSGILVLCLLLGLVHSCAHYWRTPPPDRIKIVVDRFEIHQEMAAHRHRFPLLRSSLLAPPPPPYFPPPPAYKRHSEGSSVPSSPLPSPLFSPAPTTPQNHFLGSDVELP